MTNILLVEDDPEIVELLKHSFSTSSYNLTICSKGNEAIRKAATDNFSLVILDIMLEDIDGMEVCKRLREKQIACPIMMLTSRAEEIDKVLALELGADDYVTKPFSIRELLARTKALLRRAGQNKAHDTDAVKEVHIKNLYINKEQMKASFNEKRLDLTSKEFDLLFLLASNQGKTFSRNELLEKVWGYSFEGYEHTVTSHINRLRIKMEPNLQKPEYILTTWGVGYRFTE